ncbi:MAG: hypothetical protein KGH87_01040 [Thaumarchaeota archaeon]|nr:hypothetical protein [Nitrososphaerota archaeon]MDE1838481.1 hypothetical protein [Nitrososphaerota archaeon]
MKTLHFSIITIACIVATSVVIVSVLSVQILTLQEQKRVLNETTQKLATNLTNYKDLFGDMPKNYTFLPFEVQTNVYVAGPLETVPVTTVIANQPYQIVANITKMENTQPLIYYYCIVQVSNSTGLGYHIGWGQGILTPKQSFSQCAVSWTPTVPGNYTLNAFAWRTLFGSPLANASTRYVQVVSSSSASTISIQYTNGTYASLPINYTITGDNKLLDAKMDSQSKSLILSLKSASNGTLVVSIPRVLLDAKTNDGQDDQFIVLEDGQEINYKQIDSTIIDRTLSIQFQNNTSSIEIIATHIV